MDHTRHSADVWPAGQDYWRPIVATGYLLAVSVMSVLFSRRLGSWPSVRRVPLMQLLVVSLLGGSLIFVFISAIILLGVGSSFSPAACSGGIWLCIILYAGSKVVLYVLLLEKLYIVHSHAATGRISRMQSWWYRGGCILLIAWVGIAVAMIVGRVSHIRQSDGACIIGLRLYGSVPELVCDGLTNVYLTTGFVLPILRHPSPKARRLARISSIAAVAALLTSFTNIGILAGIGGHELSWICLGSCGLDVVFNSVIVYIVTTPNRQKDEMMTANSGPHDGGPRSTQQGATSSRMGPFFRGSTTVGHGGTSTIGVHVVEEVRVDEDISPLDPPRRRASVFGSHTVSFQTAEASLDDIVEEDKARDVDLEKSSPLPSPTSTL